MNAEELKLKVDALEKELESLKSKLKEKMESEWPKHGDNYYSVEMLTEDEKRFVSLVFLNQGCKLSADIDSSDYDQPPVWEKPERLGLVKCVGSYKWVTTNKVSCTFVFDTPVCQQILHLSSI